MRHSSATHTRILLQIVMLLVYVRYVPLSTPKKRKRDKRKSATVSAVDDPAATLEVLVDRLSVWSAVADLGIEDADKEMDTDTSIQNVLQQFWTDVVVPQ